MIDWLRLRTTPVASQGRTLGADHLSSARFSCFSPSIFFGRVRSGSRIQIAIPLMKASAPTAKKGARMWISANAAATPGPTTVPRPKAAPICAIEPARSARVVRSAT